MAFRNNSLRLSNTNNNNGYQNSQNRGNVCRFYLRGYCSFGNYCRYIHTNPNDGARNYVGTENFTRNSLVPESYLIERNSSNDSNRKPHDSHSKDKVGHDNVHINTRPNTEFLTRKFQSSDKEANNDSSLAGARCSNWDHVDESGKFIPKTSSTDRDHSRECSLFNIDHGHKNDIKGGNSRLNTEASFDLSKNRESKKYSGDTKQQFDSEIALAIKRSKDKACGICMDIIVEKNSFNLRTFGILPNCNHVFCLSCIRTWRQEHQFENKIIKACPECRVHSDFVTPSKYWIDKEEVKFKLIEEYKKRLSCRPCKFFRQGKGYCTYDDKCFYLHAYPDGRKVERQSKRPRPKRLASKDAEQFAESVQAFLLAELMEECDLYDYLDLSFYSDIFDDGYDDSLLELMLG